jgi:hypothetical protein
MTCASIAVPSQSNHLSFPICSYLLVEKSNMRPLKLYVYSAATEECREVQIIPNKSWGGEGRFATSDHAFTFLTKSFIIICDEKLNLIYSQLLILIYNYSLYV